MKKRVVVVLFVAMAAGAAGIMVWRKAPAASPLATAVSVESMLQDLAGTPEPPPPPTAVDLILAALTSKRIDYETSLLYRAYALMGDERLPHEYRGAATEDLSFFHEVRRNQTRLSEAIKSQLRPFVIRPAAPGSYFNQPRAAANRKSRWLDALVAPLHAADPGECTDDNWVSENSRRYHYKVWACGAGAAAEIRRTIAALDDLWEPMTVFMETPPRYDAAGPEAGGDDRIDIYVVGMNGFAPGDRELDLAGATGMAIGEPEPDVVDSTGYLIINKRQREGFKSTVAHEFFHLLQFARNHEISDHWFVEASATWAEWQFVRETAPNEVHVRFPVFQQNDHSLHVSEPTRHTYAAYVWPFFMRQQLGDPKTITRVWKAMPSARSDPHSAMELIDRELPFAINFRVFTRRNINKAEWREALGSLYQDLDPTFPSKSPARWHPDNGVFLPASQAPRTYRVPAMGGLKAEYFAFGVLDDVKQLVFDFSGVGPIEDLDVDMILKNRVTGRFSLKALDAGESVVRLCRTFPDEDVIAVAIVFNNHNIDISKKVTGSFTVEARPEACACGTVDIDANWVKTQSVNRASAVETKRAHYTITVDAEGKVSSSGSTVHEQQSRDIMLQDFRSTTQIIRPGGKIEISPLSSDGDYTIVACTGPTETVDTGARSDTQRHISEDGTCHQITAKAGQGDKLLSGRTYTPVTYRNQYTGYQEARTFSARIANSVFAGRASGGETITWHFDVCAAPGSNSR